MNASLRILRAAPYLALAVAAHVGLVLWLACVVFPWRALKEWMGPFGPAAGVSMLVNATAVILLAFWGLAAMEWYEPELVVQAEPVEERESPHLLQGDLGGSSRKTEIDQLAESVITGSEPLTVFDVKYADIQLASSGSGQNMLALDGDTLGREVGGQSDKAAGVGKADFFGIEAGGSSFVFVVDMSGSMEGRRMRRARNELKRSIQALSETQRYFIVFYNTQAHPMPSRGMLPATQENIRDTVRWFDDVRPYGNTYPFSSLLMAVQFHPDAIFLLSDGEFDPLVIEQVLLAQHGDDEPVPIHTIGFTSHAGERVLRTLSDKSGGTYRYVR